MIQMNTFRLDPYKSVQRVDPSSFLYVATLLLRGLFHLSCVSALQAQLQPLLDHLGQLLRHARLFHQNIHERPWNGNLIYIKTFLFKVKQAN